MVSELSRLPLHEIYSSNESEINVIIESVELNKGKRNAFVDIFVSSDEQYLSEECQNCLKVNSQSANITFRPIQKSVVNRVIFNNVQSELECAIKEERLTFYDGKKMVFQTPLNHFSGDEKKYIISLNSSFAFDKVILECKSDSKDLLCINEIIFQN